MSVVDAFMATWSRARAVFGDGAPQDGSAVDASPALLQMKDDVERAKPGERWHGPGSDAYAAANEKQARTLAQTAELDQRLRAEIDRSAAVVSAGRRDLDAVREWVSNAAATVPRTPEGERMLYPVVSRGSGEIAEILERSNADMNAIAGRIRDVDTGYQALAGDLKLGTGEGAETSEDGPQKLFGDDEPWTYPTDPPPPPDSAPGGGRWQYGQGYPPGPGGGPPVGPFPVPQPWEKSVQPPVVGGTSGLQDVVPPPPNGWGEVPPVVLQEAYRFRVVGESFTNAEGHVRWVERNGMWYQAQWVDYQLEAEHVRQATGKISIPWGFNDWQPIDIKDIYRLQVDNPRLTLYIPSPTGGVLELDPNRPGTSAPR
ncbi:EspA/EspE family type VII secretion system effector [Mycolicibacterium sp.]|uniref:EspA/EspE family type VII secretion system effector n=1 Tax=Mycolicibacterium sp. TaxID=2320850 RepID=UPI003D10C0AD